MRLRTSIRSALRRLAGAAAISSFALASGAAAAAGNEPPHLIQDPHYGDTLFHFFQDHYFTAVTTLMTSQHFDRVSHHADEAEVLRGGLLLSYGMHREAGEIFSKLIERGAKPPVRDRAWFYLAKIRYQRGYMAEAEDAVGRIENHLPANLEEERGLLHANILMARADYAGAATILNGMTTKAGPGRYARFNLGVALIKSGDPARGTPLLDELGRAPAENEEYRSLRDRANVALGFAALQDNRAEAARGYLERVRLSSMHANKALLGFGWAAAALKQPKLALVPWTELVQRDASDSAVLEAKIAVPYAFAELGAYGQSLTRYTEAIEAFEHESKGLDESIAAIRSGKLVDELIERNPGEEMGWFWNIRELPEMTHSGHLTQVLAQHDFQEAFKNYRDLRFLAKNLQQWQDSLGVFGDMLANRRQAYADRLPKVRAGAQASETGLASLQQRRDGVAAEVARAETDADGLAFANDKQREQLARVASVQSILQQGAAEPEIAATRERARLAAGALTWQLAHDFPARLWQAKKSLQTIDTELFGALRRDGALAQAQRDEPLRFEQFAVRIAALGPRIEALIPRVAALSKEQQGAVEDLAVAELTRQKERIAAYTTHARFALAQLYDRANLKKDADHVPKP